MVYLICLEKTHICMTCSFLWSISRLVGAGSRPVPGKCDKSVVAQELGDLDFAKIVQRGGLRRWLQFCQFHGVSGCFTLFYVIRSVQILLEWFCSKKKLRRVSRIRFFGITTLYQWDSYKSCRTSHQVAGTIRSQDTHGLRHLSHSVLNNLLFGLFFKTNTQESSMMPKFEGDIPRSFALKPMVVWLWFGLG